jgi:hypothetical protein
MAITYTWTITGMQVISLTQEPEYVVNAFWTKTGTDELGNTGFYTGETNFAPDPEQTDFIPYDQLTQEIVISWVQPIVDNSYGPFADAQIQKQIDAKIYPVTQPPLPWGDPPTPIPPAPPVPTTP